MWRPLVLGIVAAGPCGVGRALVTKQGATSDDEKKHRPIELWGPAAQSLPPLERAHKFGRETYGPSSDRLIAKMCCPNDTTKTYQNVTNPQLVPYYVDMGSPLRTNVAMLVIPGGGFDFLSWEKEGTDIAKWLNDLGITAFVLKYRVPIRPWVESAITHQPWVSGPGVEDAARAMRIIRYAAMSDEQYTISPQKIGAIGFSAGGEIALQLYASINEQPYSRRDKIDNVRFDPDFLMMIYSQGLPYLQQPRPYKLPPPPVFMATAKNDQCETVNKVQATAFELTKKGGKVDLHVYPDGFHGYGRCTLYTTLDKHWSACNWPQRAAEFLHTFTESNALGPKSDSNA